MVNRINVLDYIKSNVVDLSYILILDIHLLPTVNEISIDVDKDKRACYFKQVLNGKYMRVD